MWEGLRASERAPIVKVKLRSASRSASPNSIAGTCSDVRDNNLSSAIVNAYFCAFIRRCQNDGGPATRKSDAPLRGEPQRRKGAQLFNPAEGLPYWRVGECAPTLMRLAYRTNRGRPGSPNGHSNAARSHRPRSAAASYVVWRNFINVRSGSGALRTAS